MPMLPPVVVELQANANKLTAGLNQASKDIDNLGKTGASTFDKVSAAAGKYGAAIGGAMTAAGVALQKIAGPLEQSHALLKQAIQNTGNDFSDFKGQIDQTVGSMEKYGHTSADTQGALAKLTAATGDPTKALSEMGLAADLAAAKHISLSDAAGLVVKMSAGSGKVFKEFGINLKDFGTGADAAQKATDVLKLKLQGMADAASDTTQGKFDALRARITDVAAALGQKLVPFLTTAGPLLMGLSSIAPAVSKGFDGISTAVGFLASNPLTLAVTALGAVAAALFLTRNAGQDVIVTMKDLGQASQDAVISKLKDVRTQLDLTTAAMEKSSSLTDRLGTNAIAFSKAQRNLKEVTADFNNVLDKNPELAQKFIDDAKAAGYETADWQKKLESKIQADRDHQQALDDYRQKVQGATQAGVEHKADLDEQKAATKELTAEEKKRQEFIDAQAKQVQKDYDDQQKALTDLAAVYGDKNADMIKWAGLSTDAIKKFTDQGRNTDRDVSLGFSHIGDIIGAFGDKTKVTAGQVDKFFKDQVTAAQNWESNLKTLVDKGVNQDLVEQIAAAGPKAAPLLQGIVDEVNKKGVESVNAAMSQIKTAQDDTATYIKNARANILAASSDIQNAVDGWAMALPTNVNIAVTNKIKQDGARAGGGPVSSGSVYLVGEAGPELFVPNTSGNIVPNNRLSSGGGTQVFNVTVNAGLGVDGAALGRQIIDAMKAYVRVSGYGSGSPVLV